MDRYRMQMKGFTLIELLVVIAIIGILSSVVLASLSSSRSRGLDAARQKQLEQLSNAVLLYNLDTQSYPASAGWLSNAGHGGLDAALVPKYISVIRDDPRGSPDYQYWRKDYRYAGYPCMTTGTDQQYAFYAQLDAPTAAQLATISDAFDQCVKNTWGMNFKIGN